MSALLDLETRAAALLEAASYFSDVLVRAQHHGDLAAVIAERLAAGVSKTDTKKPGLLVLVSVTGAGLGSGSSGSGFQPRPGRVLAALTVAVLENPLVNKGAAGSGKAALAVAEEVFKAIAHAGVHDVSTPTARFAPADPVIELLSPDEKRARYGIEGGLGYHVHFTAGVNL